MPIQHKGGTRAAWLNSALILAPRQLGVAVDTGELRVGNGVNLWKDLPKPTANLEIRDRTGAFDVRDFGAKGDGATDDSAAFQAAMTAAGAVKGEVTVPAGRWVIDNVGVPDNVAVRGLGARPVRFGTGGGVVLVHKTDSANPMLVLNGNADSLEGLTLDGNAAPGTVLLVRQGFENRLHHVRVINGAGLGLEVRGAGNQTWHDVFVDNCGSATLPGVLINGAERSINTLDLTGLTVERCKGVHIQIGQDGDAHVPEFLRIANLHVESVDDNGGVPNAVGVPLLDVRHARSVCLVNPYIYGGPGPLIRHLQGTSAAGPVLGGLAVIGGTLLGRSSATGLRPDVLIDLVQGTEFTMTGTRLDECVAGAVRAAGGYGSRVFIAPDVIFTPRTGGRFTDQRTIDPQPYRFDGPVTFNGRLVSNVPSTRPAVVSDAGGPAPATSAHNDTKGTIFFGSGAAPVAGKQLALTFAKPYAAAPVVQLTPRTKATFDLGLYVVETATGFSVHTSNAPAGNQAATTYSFHYSVIG